MSNIEDTRRTFIGEEEPRDLTPEELAGISGGIGTAGTNVKCSGCGSPDVRQYVQRKGSMYLRVCRCNKCGREWYANKGSS